MPCIDVGELGAGTGVLRVRPDEASGVSRGAAFDAGTAALRVDEDEVGGGTGMLRATAFASDSGAGVLGPSTDHPSARFAIRPIVSSPRGTGVERALGGGALELPRRRLDGSDSSSGAPAPGIAPMFGVALISDAARALAAPVDGEPVAAERVRALDGSAVGGLVRPLDSPGVFERFDSPDAVRAGSVDAGGDGRAGGPVRVGAGVAAGVPAPGESSLGDSTDQPDARSAIRLLVSSPSRRRVRSSSGTHRP